MEKQLHVAMAAMNANVSMEKYARLREYAVLFINLSLSILSLPLHLIKKLFELFADTEKASVAYLQKWISFADKVISSQSLCMSLHVEQCLVSLLLQYCCLIFFCLKL